MTYRELLSKLQSLPNYALDKEAWFFVPDEFYCCKVAHVVLFKDNASFPNDDSHPILSSEDVVGFPEVKEIL